MANATQPKQNYPRAILSTVSDEKGSLTDNYPSPPTRGILNDCIGRALRGASRTRGGTTTFSPLPACALRLLVKEGPRRENSSAGGESIPACIGDGTMGENGRGVEDGEYDDTCSKITSSDVAFVSFAMALRNVEDRAWGLPP